MSAENRNGMPDWEAVLNCLPEPMLVTDPDQRILYLNRAAAEYFRVTGAGCWGRHCSVLNTPACGAEQCSLRCYLRGERNIIRTGRDGRSFRVDISPLTDRTGCLMGYVSFFSDVTKLLESQNQLRTDRERYRIALSPGNNSVWEFSVKDRTLYRPDAARDPGSDELGLGAVVGEVPDALIGDGFIQEESAEDFAEMFRAVDRGDLHSACTVKIRTPAGLRWRKMTVTTILGEDGKPSRAIGMSQDVTAEKEREWELLGKAERDPLTGLYNRGAAFDLVEGLLQKPDRGLCALLMLDVDDFKRVNDSCGHLFGDAVLAGTARRLNSVFRRGDVVARLGGDEFIVFLLDLPGEEIAVRKAWQLCTPLPTLGPSGESSSVTCSVGVAFTGTGENTFRDLYARADAALYQSKNSGKHSVTLFREGMLSSGTV